MNFSRQSVAPETVMAVVTVSIETVAVVTRPPPTIAGIKTEAVAGVVVARISVAITAGNGPITWIAVVPISRTHSGPLSSAVLKVFLGHWHESLLAVSRVYLYGIHQAERELRLGLENGGSPACKENRADAGNGACAGSNRRSRAPVRS